jgi:hypothetical protein
MFCLDIPRLGASGSMSSCVRVSRPALSSQLQLVYSSTIAARVESLDTIIHNDLLGKSLSRGLWPNVFWWEVLCVERLSC